MKTVQTITTVVLAGCLLAGFAVNSRASITANYQTSGSSVSFFDGNITVNLVKAGQSSLASASADTSALNGTFNASGLNDGSAAGTANDTYYAVTTGIGTITPTKAIFQLTAGYNITNIEVISGWTDHNLGEHCFQLLLSVAGGPFTSYGFFTNNTSVDPGSSGPGAWMTTLTGSSGTIASNVTGIEFIFLNPDTSNGAGSVGNSQGGSNGGSVIHEVQVFGTYCTNLPVLPAVTAQYQTNGTSDSFFDSNITPNLITAGQSSLSGSLIADSSALNGTFLTSGLNDGSGAGPGNWTYYAITPNNGGPDMPNTATFYLTAGYNITNIQVISGWGDHDLGEQSFQLLLSVAGGPFTSYGIFNNNAPIATDFNGPGSWMTTLTASSGTIATNVTGVQFIFLNPDTSNGPGGVGNSQADNNSTGGTVIHELQVFGTSYTNLSLISPTISADYETNAGSDSFFDSYITANLIQAGQSSLASVTADPTALAAAAGFSTSGLNDGSGAGNGNLTYYSAIFNPMPNDGTSMPDSATFQLTAAYDITNIQVISGWNDHNLGEQCFELLFSVNGGAFRSYGTFTNNASIATGFTGPGSWMTTLTSSTGIIASKVTGIEFVFLNPDTSNGAGAVGNSQAGDNANGGTVIHELQVFGTPTINLTIQSVPGNQLQVNWAQGTLLQSPNITGPWTTNTAAAPYTFTPTGSQMFFRVQVP